MPLDISVLDELPEIERLIEKYKEGENKEPNFDEPGFDLTSDKYILKEYKNKNLHNILYGNDDEVHFCNNKKTNIIEKSLVRNFTFDTIMGVYDDYYNKISYLFNVDKEESLYTFFENRNVVDISEASQLAKAGRISNVITDDSLKKFLKVNLEDYVFEAYGHKRYEKIIKGEKNVFVYYPGSRNIRLIIKVSNREKCPTPENLSERAKSYDFLHFEKCTCNIKLEYLYKECEICGEIVGDDDFSYGHSIELLGEYIFNDEDKIKVTKIYKQIIAKRLASGEAKAYFRLYKDMLVFNKTTERIYSINKFHIKGHDYLKYSEPRTIKDITYNVNETVMSIGFNSKEIHHTSDNIFMSLINKHIKNKYPDLYMYTKKDIDNGLFYTAHGSTTNSYINEIRRNVFLKAKLGINNTVLSSYILSIRSYDGEILQKLKGMTEKQISKYIKLKPADIMKLKATNSTSLGLNMHKYITNVDYLKNIMFKAQNYLYSRSVHVTNVQKRHNIFDVYLKANSEKKFYNQMMNSTTYDVYDTFEMFKDIKKKMPEYSIDLKDKSFKEIHDILSKDINKVNDKKKKIVRDKKLYALVKEWSFGDITYTLARDTFELVDVGSYMSICVGGYGHRAVKKECFILIGYDKNNNPATCIELKKKGETFKIEQVKKSRNQLAGIDEAEYIRDMCLISGIDYNTSDLTTVLKKKNKIPMFGYEIA